jgi:flagellar motor switch protein FliN/FliY
VNGPAALAHFGDATAAAALGVLDHLAPGLLDGRDVRILSGEGDAFDGLPAPIVAVSGGYADGVGGTNVLALPFEAARRLAGGTGGDSGQLSDAERSALEEAADKILSSVAATLSTMLDGPVERGSLQTRTFPGTADVGGSYPPTPHAVAISFTFGGDPCRIVLLVPNALVVRLSDALHEIGPVAARGDGDPGWEAGVRPSLDGIPVRVWAELGRARMPSEQFVGLPAGAVVELDHHPDDPIELFVNGRRFATGRLVVVDGTEWAVRIEEVL